MLTLVSDFQRILGRRDDLNRGGSSKLIIPVGYACDRRRISTGSCQHSISNQCITIRPQDRVLLRLNHGTAILDRNYRIFLLPIVCIGRFRQFHLGRDGLGCDGHRNRSLVHVYAVVIGGSVYLIIDRVRTGIGPGGNLRGEIGSVQRIDQETHAALPRRDQRLGLTVVGQRVNFCWGGGNFCFRLLDGHRNRRYQNIIVVLITLDLIVDRVIPCFGARGNRVAISTRRTVQCVLNCAAAELARLQQLLGRAGVDKDSRSRFL